MMLGNLKRPSPPDRRSGPGRRESGRNLPDVSGGHESAGTAGWQLAVPRAHRLGKNPGRRSHGRGLFGDARACIKIDCAEFQHSHEIAKLIGSPPGYLGHRETHPLLTQEVLNQWHTEKLKLSILLFDEIEKASDALWQLLLGILDKATLTLGDNRRVDFSQCMIIMTSNLGASEMSNMVDGGIGFSRRKSVQVDAAFDDKIKRTAVEAARRKFSPEFMNRIDKSVVFKTLRSEHLQQILDIELGMVQQRILTASADEPVRFQLHTESEGISAARGTDPKYGARHLKRAIERHIVFPLANLVATGQVKLGDFIRIDMVRKASSCSSRKRRTPWSRCCWSVTAPPPERFPWRVLHAQLLAASSERQERWTASNRSGWSRPSGLHTDEYECWASAPEVPQRLKPLVVLRQCSAKALLHPKKKKGSLAWTAEGGCPHGFRGATTTLVLEH